MYFCLTLLLLFDIYESYFCIYVYIYIHIYIVSNVMIIYLCCSNCLNKNVLVQNVFFCVLAGGVLKGGFAQGAIQTRTITGKRTC